MILAIFNATNVIFTKKIKINQIDFYALLLVYVATYIFLPRSVFADYDGYGKYIDYLQTESDIYNEPLMMAYFYFVRAIVDTSEDALNIIYFLNFILFMGFVIYLRNTLGNVNAYLIVIILGSTLAFVTLRATPAYILIALSLSDKFHVIRIVKTSIAVACHYSAFPVLLLIEIFQSKKIASKLIFLIITIALIYYIYINIESLLGLRIDILNIDIGLKFYIFILINLILIFKIQSIKEQVKNYKLILSLLGIGFILSVNSVLYVRYMMYALIIFLATNSISDKASLGIIIIKLISPILYFSTFWYVLGNV
jgi:hypothetical protein